MGIESVAYRFEPMACEMVDLVDLLRLRGAAGGDRPGTYVLSGPEHWIDILVRTNGSRVAVVQFRIAVTNPAPVVRVLDELMADLLARFGGRVSDASGRKALDDQGRLDALTSDFATGRRRFTENFGELILPVSADRVFAQLRKAPPGDE